MLWRMIRPTGAGVAAAFSLTAAGPVASGTAVFGALLHDTGKGRSTTEHARASAQLADGVTERLELEPFDRDLVRRLIDCHLEMSAALRRDIFDADTVRVFAERIGTHDLLRMLTLFTYADISAVHRTR